MKDDDLTAAKVEQALQAQEAQQAQQAEETERFEEIEVPEEAELPEISPQELAMAMDTLRAEQKLVPGAVAGLLASLIGAGIWAGITVATEYQIGWMAVGIGFLVGLAVRQAGRGIDQGFGVLGAFLSLLGCAVGNVLWISYFIGTNEGIAFMDVLVQLNPELVVGLLVDTFEPMDALFYGLAAYFGYKYAFRQVTVDDVQRALGKAF